MVAKIIWASANSKSSNLLKPSVFERIPVKLLSHIHLLSFQNLWLHRNAVLSSHQSPLILITSFCYKTEYFSSNFEFLISRVKNQLFCVLFFELELFLNVRRWSKRNNPLSIMTILFSDLGHKNQFNYTFLHYSNYSISKPP